MKKDTAYIGVNGTHKKVLKKHISVDSTWKPQKHSWVGKNGYWILSHSDTPIDYTKNFSIRRLEGYTMEPENVNVMRGDGIKDYQYPSPRVGSYYELQKNLSDIFENFGNGTTIGATIATVSNQNSLLFNTTTGYFKPNSDWTANGFFGNDGMSKNFVLGMHFYINELPAVDSLLPIFSTGGAEAGYIIGVNSNGKIEQQVWKSNVKEVNTSVNAFSLGWNSMVIQRINGVITLHTLNETTNISANIMGQPLTDELFFGASWKYLTATPINPEISPTGIFYSNKTYYSQSGSAIKNLYISSTPVDNINIQKLLTRQDPVVVFKNLDTLTETIVPTEWVNAVKNDQVVYTLPTNFTLGSYENFIRFHTGEESNKFPVKVIATQKRVTYFLDDYSDNNTLKDNYYLLNRQWGGANGGVVAENVFIRDGELILRAHGDLYTGDIQGVDRDGNPKFHTHVNDPKLGQPWTNRVGACVVFKEKTGYGSYEIEAFIPNKLGVCYAMWTFFYNEIYPNDPRWDDFIADGLHQQGTQEDGYYVTRNHEIDIELPSHLDGGVYSQPSLSNMKCNTWRGELQNWDVPPTDPTYWEEYRDNLTPIGFNIADGNYHKLRFDWHNDRVEFYIDGVLKRINTNTAKGNTIPNIPGHFTFGLWFPSSPMLAKPWLVRPERAWAGGVIDPVDGGMKADFDVVEMKVKKFTFTPFNEPGENVTGETYAFGGYRIKNDNNV